MADNIVRTNGIVYANTEKNSNSAVLQLLQNQHSYVGDAPTILIIVVDKSIIIYYVGCTNYC